MFVSCYDVPIPIGKMNWTRPNLDRGTLVEAVVKVPDMFVGPLPHRHRGHLLFPVGTFKDWWDTRLLRYACEELKCDVKLLRQLESDEAPILKEFGELMTQLSSTENEELGRIWKIFGLRLTGKFGQHRQRTEIAHISEIKDQTGYYPIDEQEIYHERTVYMDGNKSPYIKPAVNMRIRSEAQLRHLKYLLKAKHVYYCDTDSVYTDTIQPAGVHPGELRQIDFAKRAYFIGCKFYGYINREGLLKQKTSGFRDTELTEGDFKKLLRGEELPKTYETMSNWREILRGKGVTLVQSPRQLKEPEFQNRLAMGLETYPVKLKERIK
jgi:hypothetical protein